MTPEDIERDKAFKKAMEAINAFNKEAKGLNKTIGEITGKK